MRAEKASSESRASEAMKRLESLESLESLERRRGQERTAGILPENSASARLSQFTY